MTNIVICDDNREFCSNLQKQLKTKLSFECQIYKYYKLDSNFKKYIISNKSATVFILDIDLKTEDSDGYSIAKKIRQIRNFIDEIIFLTNKTYISKKIITYKIQPIDFIEKSNYYMIDLLKALEISKEKLNAKEEDKDKGVLTLYENKALYNVGYKDIIYIELLKDSRNMMIKMHPEFYKGEFYIISSINSIMKKLDDRFFLISRNLIINKDYISYCNPDTKEIGLKYNYTFTGSEIKIRELIKCMRN